MAETYLVIYIGVELVVAGYLFDAKATATQGILLSALWPCTLLLALGTWLHRQAVAMGLADG
jgi:hypothetical protein